MKPQTKIMVVVVIVLLGIISAVSSEDKQLTHDISRKLYDGMDEILVVQIEDEVEALRSTSLKESILQLVVIGSSIPTQSPTTPVPSPKPTALPSSKAPKFKSTHAPTHSPTEEPTNSPTEAPSFSVTLIPTATPSFTYAPTATPTKETVPAAGSSVAFQLANTVGIKNCSSFLQDGIVSTTVQAVVISSKADIGIFWKCVQSNGETFFFNGTAGVYYRVGGRRSLVSPGKEERQDRRQLLPTSANNYTLYVNVSITLPKNSPPEVVQQTQQSLTQDVHTAFVNQTFTQTLATQAAANNVPALLNSSSQSAQQTPFVGEAQVNPPTAAPTEAPTAPSASPSFTSTTSPRFLPSRAPVSRKPSSIAPSATPTLAPSGPSIAPTEAPTDEPSHKPSGAPSKPTFTPTLSPSVVPSIVPSAPTVAPTASPTGAAKLNVTILAASFATKHNVPIRKNSSTCEVIGTHDVRVLNLIIKVENDGSGNFVVSPSDLTYEKCNHLVQSYPTFYSIKIFNTVKTRAERCVADTVSPKYYTCTSNSSQGISVHNYLISHQYVDVSNSGLVAGQRYIVEVTVLPHNAFLTAVSPAFNITYTATDARRRSLFFSF